MIGPSLPLLPNDASGMWEGQAEVCPGVCYACGQHFLSAKRIDLLSFRFSHFGPFLDVPKGDHLLVLPGVSMTL